MEQESYIGRTVGSYRILSKLGEGGMGVALVRRLRNTTGSLLLLLTLGILICVATAGCNQRNDTQDAQGTQEVQEADDVEEPEKPPSSQTPQENRIALPSGFEKDFILPDTDKDQHGNPVVTRNGLRTDPETKFPFEIWLKSPRMEFVLIPAGEFMMGSILNRSEFMMKSIFNKFEKPVHRVTLSSFFLAKYEVTQAQWRKVVGNNPSSYKGDNRPVEKVSWNDCRGFCSKIGLSLPSEAQWEYACRAGTSTKFCCGDSESELNKYAWFYSNAGYETHSVGKKRPNSWGLYDMHGNLWEWCRDAFHENYWGAPADGSAWTESKSGPRVRRGGGCDYDATNCRSAVRMGNDPGFRHQVTGFRPVRRFESQLPAENAKAVLGELTDVKDSLLYDYWVSYSTNKVKTGYGHFVSEKATDEKGNPAYKLTSTAVVLTASGKVAKTEKAFLSPSLRITSRIWGAQGFIHGFGEIKEGANQTFSWTDGQVKITTAGKAQEGEKVTILSTLPDTICEISFLFPFLARKGPAKYAFSLLDIDEDLVGKVHDVHVEVLAAREMIINGKTLKAVEVRNEDGSMFFGTGGAFLMGSSVQQFTIAPSKEQAVSGLVPFDPEGDTDWTSVTKPVDIIKVYFYAMIKQDTALFEKIFSFRRFIKSMLEAEGKPVNDAILDRIMAMGNMMAMGKSKLGEDLFKNVKGIKPHHLLIVPGATDVKMLSEDKAVLTLLGKHLFTVEKVKGAWMIVKFD
jgi:formylglycine-generating enzyme required for sulfatase activity